MALAVEDQSGAAALLGDPATHGGAPVRRIDTHGAMVFLAGDLAWKLKRAVAFPYMDFSTPARRQAACRAEVRLNRRTAPTLYRGVVALVEEAGRWRLAADPGGETPPDLPALPPVGAATVRDWAVVLRRFPDGALLDAQAPEALTPALMDRLADAIAAFHDAAEVHTDADPGALAEIVAGNLDGLRAAPELFPPNAVARLADLSASALDRLRPLLARRVVDGRVRHCHGDLHLRNIVLLDGAPTLFDAIEFNDAFAVIDVLYDLAFLLMDLEQRGLRAQANRVLNRYLERTGDLDGLALLPLLLAARATVRAKVGVPIAEAQTDPNQAAAARAEARAYCDAALDFLAPPPPRLIAVGGLSGTGKTTLARALAPALDPAPGAVVIRSDVLRKRRAGVPETERLPAEAYTPDASAAVYADLLDACRRVLAAGHPVIADAVCARPNERAALAALATERGVRFDGLWLEAPTDALTARVTARTADASDADAQVVALQQTYDTGPIDWPRLPTGAPPDRVAAEARRLLGLGA